MQALHELSTGHHRRRHPPVGRSRSWRAEKRGKCCSSMKFTISSVEDSGISKPSSISATASPKRAISPEVRNWQRRGKFSPTNERSNLQILLSPRSDESNTDCPFSSASSPTTWGNSSVDERLARAAYFSSNTTPDEIPLSPSSGYASKTPSMGIGTPLLSNNRKVVQLPTDLQPTQKSESVFSGIRVAFNRWLDNMRSKNSAAASKNRQDTSGKPNSAAPKCRGTEELPRPTVLQNDQNKNLASRRVPNAPAPLIITSTPTGSRAINLRKEEVQRLKEITSMDYNMDATISDRYGRSVLTTEEVERLAQAVTVATTREAQIEAAEKLRRETSARVFKYPLLDQQRNLSPSGRNVDVPVMQDIQARCSENSVMNKLKGQFFGEQCSEHAHGISESTNLCAVGRSLNESSTSTLLEFRSSSTLEPSPSQCAVCKQWIVSCPICHKVCEPIPVQLAQAAQDEHFSKEKLLCRMCENTTRDGSDSENDIKIPRRVSRQKHSRHSHTRNGHRVLRNKLKSASFDHYQRSSIAVTGSMLIDNALHASKYSSNQQLPVPYRTRSVSCPPERFKGIDIEILSAQNSLASTSENLSSTQSDCEFNIPFRDIKLIECVGQGRRKAIYRGEWHGEVMLHIFDSLNHEERGRFWQDVMRLMMTRHENIALFMGACMEPPKFAIVTSACKGISLYEKLHVQQEKIPRRFPFQILRQVAHAMEYLHSRVRPIIIRHLSSRNIFLQPKVVLSLTDYASMECSYQNPNCVPVSSTCLRYIAPELFQSHMLDKHGLPCHATHLKERLHSELMLGHLHTMAAFEDEPSTDREDIDESTSGSESPIIGSTRSQHRPTRIVLPKAPTILNTENTNRDFQPASPIQIPGYNNVHNLHPMARNIIGPTNRPKRRRCTRKSTFYFRESAFTEATDVYAFGTIIFELHARRYPFHGVDTASFIAAVCAGQRDEGSRWCSAESVKNLMLRCWSPTPNHRPCVRQLTQDIMHNHIHYRRQHSDPTNTHWFSSGD